MAAIFARVTPRGPCSTEAKETHRIVVFRSLTASGSTSSGVLWLRETVVKVNGRLLDVNWVVFLVSFVLELGTDFLLLRCFFFLS